MYFLLSWLLAWLLCFRKYPMQLPRQCAHEGCTHHNGVGGCQEFGRAARSKRTKLRCQKTARPRENEQGRSTKCLRRKENSLCVDLGSPNTACCYSASCLPEAKFPHPIFLTMLSSHRCLPNVCCHIFEFRVACFASWIAKSFSKWNSYD